MRKKEKFQSSNLRSHLKNLEKEKQKLIELKGEIDKTTIMVGHLNTSLSVIGRTST